VRDLEWPPGGAQMGEWRGFEGLRNRGSGGPAEALTSPLSASRGVDLSFESVCDANPPHSHYGERRFANHGKSDRTAHPPLVVVVQRIFAETATIPIGRSGNPCDLAPSTWLTSAYGRVIGHARNTRRLAAREKGQ